MYIGVIIISICTFLLIYFFQSIKKLLVVEFEGRLRRLEMEVQDIECKFAHRSNN